METGEHLIWSNDTGNVDALMEDIKADNPDLSESELFNACYDQLNDYLDDERINLDIQLSEPILVIADLGLWNGRHSGYKELQSGNIKDCLYSDTDYATWFVDKLGDLRCDAIHHDGTNHYLYRTYKSGISEQQKESLKQKIYEGSATRSDIVRVTKRLGDDIAAVYGFKLSRPSVREQLPASHIQAPTKTTVKLHEQAL